MKIAVVLVVLHNTMFVVISQLFLVVLHSTCRPEMELISFGNVVHILVISVYLFLSLINHEGKLDVGTSVEAVVSLMHTPGRHSPSFLAEVARVLNPGGSFLVLEPLLVETQEQKVCY